MKCVRSLLPLVSMLACGSAVAHTQDGSLGDAAAATDYYQVTCNDDGSGPPGSLVAQVQHRGPAATPVSVVVHRATAATTTVDTVPGDVTPSPLVYVNGGDGVYNVFVSKAGSGLVNYTLSFHCMTGQNGGGLHTGTIIVFRQNQ
ncbi:MAG: hypothetical protein U1F41_12770 [Burkholderiales bacterium]